MKKNYTKLLKVKTSRLITPMKRAAAIIVSLIVSFLASSSFIIFLVGRHSFYIAGWYYTISLFLIPAIRRGDRVINQFAFEAWGDRRELPCKICKYLTCATSITGRSTERSVGQLPNALKKNLASTSS